MPANVIKSFAQETGKSAEEVEKLWDKAKEIAKDEGQDENYAYITGILKKMLKINETVLSGDLGTHPDTALFKSPKKKKKRMSFKEYVLTTDQTDTFIKEKGEPKDDL